MKNTILTSLLAGFASVSLLTAQSFNDDFESSISGDQPTATAVRPTSNTATVFAEIVADGSNSAGSGNGLRLFDNDSGSAFAYETNFVGDSGSQASSMHISYDLAWNADLGISGNYGRFGVGAFDESTAATLNSSGNIFLEIRWGSDGVFRAVGGTGNSTTNLTLGTGVAIDIYINDFDSQSINYSAPDGGGTVALSANSFAVYVDSVLLRTDTLKNAALTGDSNLGRMGVVSFGSHTGIDYTIDNFNASAIPEPSNYALAMSVIGLALTGIYRRRKA
jgi:hypothetical protein